MSGPAPGGTDRPAAVLVDMDGTLVLTEDLWLEAETAVMAELGAGWTSDDQAACLGGPLLRAAEYMAERAGSEVPAEEVAHRVISTMEALLRSEPVHWTPGSAELLDSVRLAGIPVALVSASTRNLVDAVLDRIGRHHFATTVAGDEVAESKPHPEPYLLAAARLGVDPRSCAVLEDSPVGVQAGLASGAVTVAVPHLVAVPEAPGLHVVPSLADVTLDHLRAWSHAHHP